MFYVLDLLNTYPPERVKIIRTKPHTHEKTQPDDFQPKKGSQICIYEPNNILIT